MYPNLKTRPIRLDDLSVFESIPGFIGLVRNTSFELTWCTQQFTRLVNTNFNLMGTTLRDIFGPTAAMEREELQVEVINTQLPVSHLQFCSDIRFQCTVFPLCEASFGHHGVLVIMKESANDAEQDDPNIRLLPTPELHELKALSTRELDVLYFISHGLSTHEIADKQIRSHKTIENQINSIHTKLQTHTRPELVVYTAKCGIQSFTYKQWSRIIVGAKAARKEAV
jgi:DNA-binding CsgD family transcriptional regulator